MLKEMVGGKRKVNIDNLEFFSDKIKIYEVFYGENERTKILWKLNNIRNNLSHNKINDLNYNGESLSLRETKEKVLIDYVETGTKIDPLKAKFWNSLTETQKKNVLTLLEKANQEGKV